MIIRDLKGTPILDLPFNVVNGELPDLAYTRKFGRIVGLGTVEYTIWTGSGNPTFPVSADPLPTAYIASTNSADIAGIGQGAEYALVDYLSSGWVGQTEIHSLNGLNPVPLNLPFWRVNGFRVLTKNYLGINTGDIWLGTSAFTAGVPAAKYGHIVSGIGNTYQAFYSTPYNKFAYIYDIIATVNIGKSSAIQVFAQSFAETFSGFPGLINPRTGQGNYDVFEDVMTQNRKLPAVLSPMNDIIFKGKGAAAGTDISIEWTMLNLNVSYLTNDNR